MNRFHALSLRTKLNLALAVLLAAFGAALAAILLIGFERTQGDATASSRKGLEQQSQETLGVLTATQAQVGQLQLSSAADLSLLASRYMTESLRLEVRYPADPDRLTVRDGIVFDARLGRDSDIWYPGALPLAGQALQDFDQSGALEALLQTLYETQGLSRESNFQPVAVYYTGPSGLLRYFPPIGLEKVLDPKIVPTEGIYYTIATPEQNPGRGTVWTPPYEDQAGKGMLLTASTPVYINNQFRGVVSVDLSLERLSAQIDAIGAGETGFAFYVGSDGQLLDTAGAPRVRAALEDDSNTALRTAIDEMAIGTAGNRRIQFDGEEMFLSYAPLPGPGGSLAMITPVSELNESARDVAASIEAEGNRTIIAMLATLAALLVGALVFTAWLYRRLLVEPIETLVAGTRAVAAGDLTTTIPVRAKDELGTLAGSFNQMTSELALGRSQLEEKEAQFREIFEATNDGVIINDPETGRVVDANPAACAMHGYTREEFIGMAPEQFIHADSLPIFADYVATLRAGRDYRGQAIDIRSDGTSFAVEVTGAPLEYQGKVHFLGVVRDVTEQVRAYELLEERVDERTRELQTLLRVSRSVGATLELDALLESILTQLHEVIDYSGSSVLIEEEGSFTILLTRAGQGVDPARVRGSLGRRFPFDGANDILATLQRGDPMVVDDVRGDSRGARAFRTAVGEVETGAFSHVRSWMALPLMSRGRLLGFLSASRSEPGYFQERHAELAMAFATVAAASLANANLFAQAQRRARENAALASIASLFALEEETRETLNGLATSVCAATGASAASVMLLEGGRPAVFGSAGLPEGYVETVAQCIDAGADWPAARAIDARQVVLLEDGVPETMEREEWAPLRPYLEQVPWRAMIFLPIVYRDTAIGSLAAYYRPSEIPGDDERRFLRAIADQAAVGLENRTLFEQAERRVRENEALAAISSRFTLQEPTRSTLDGVAQSVRDATSAVAASIVLVSSGRVEAFGQASLPDGYIDAMVSTLGSHGSSIMLMATANGATIRLPDARTEILGRDEYGEIHGLLHDVAWEGIVATPLIYRERIIGAIGAYYPAGKMPSEQELAFLQALADHAAIGVENVRLFGQTERRVLELEALTRIAASLTVVQPIDTTLGALADAVVDSTAAVACSVILMDPETEELRFAAQRGLSDGFVEAMAASWGGSVSHADGDDTTTVAADTIVAFRSGEPRTIRNAKRRLLRTPGYGALRPYIESVEWDAIGVIPISYQGAPLGALACYFRPEDGPEARDIHFLRGIADQAAAAVQNARLFSAAEERAQQLNALYQADEELHSSLELDAVTQAIVDVAVDLLGADGASFTIWDEATGQARVRVAGHALRMARNELVAELARHREMRPEELTVHAAEDVRNEPGIDQANAERIGIRSFIRVPVIVAGKLFGIFDSAYTKPRAFRMEDQRLFTALAQRAAIAIENAQLFEAGELRTRQIDALYRADQALHRSLQVDEVLQALADVAVNVLGADRSMFVTWLPDEEYPIVRAASGVDQEMYIALADSFRRNGNPTGFERRDILTVNDTSVATGADEERVRIARIRALAQLPIIVGDEVFGIFYLGYESPRVFGAEDERVFTALAQRAAVAVENARLYEQASEVALMGERNRIARDLHDRVSQVLYSINLFASAARTYLGRGDAEAAAAPLEQVQKQAGSGLAEMRALIFELRPESLKEEGIIRAIEKLVASSEDRYGVRVQATLPDVEPDVPLGAKEMLYRVASEAVHNIAKHAQATEADIVLDLQPGHVVLDIRDNGKGFDPTGEFPGHLGLKSMRERAAQLAGTFEIRSSPGAGTHIRVRIPR